MIINSAKNNETSKIGDEMLIQSTGYMIISDRCRLIGVKVKII